MSCPIFLACGGSAQVIVSPIRITILWYKILCGGSVGTSQTSMNVGMHCGPYSHTGKYWNIADLEMVGQSHPDHVTEGGGATCMRQATC